MAAVLVCAMESLVAFGKSTRTNRKARYNQSIQKVRKEDNLDAEFKGMSRIICAKTTSAVCECQVNQE